MNPFDIGDAESDKVKTRLRQGLAEGTQELFQTPDRAIYCPRCCIMATQDVDVKHLSSNGKRSASVIPLSISLKRLYGKAT